MSGAFVDQFTNLQHQFGTLRLEQFGEIFLTEYFTQIRADDVVELALRNTL